MGPELNLFFFFNSVLPTIYKLHLERTFWKGIVSGLDLCKINYHVL